MSFQKKQYDQEFLTSVNNQNSSYGEKNAPYRHSATENTPINNNANMNRNLNSDTFPSNRSETLETEEKVQNNSMLLTSKQKLFLTFIYCITFWNFGICVAIFGPTLLDLACQTSSTLSAMSLLYFMQNFTSLIGCFVSGVILKNKWISISNFLLICTILMPACVSLMPMAKHIAFLGFVMAFLGFNMGCVDNIANLAILKLHSNNVSPFIQTMHFFYGIGAFFTPVIVKSFLNSNFDITITSNSFNCYNIEDVLKNKPYLSSNSLSVHEKESSSSSHLKIVLPLLNKTILNSQELIPTLLTTKTHFTSKTKYAFWILSLIQLPAPLILLLVKFAGDKLNNNYNNFDLNLSKETEQKENEFSESTSFSFSLDYFKSLLRGNKIILHMTLLISFLVFLFEGLQASHGGYIFSYAVEKYDINQTKLVMLKNNTKEKMIINRHHHQNSDDAYITATFWAFFSIGRLASIFIATKFSSSFMILIDIIGCFVSASLMLFSSFVSMIGLLYFATCLLGLFLSNTTPTIYSIAEIHIGMTPTLTSFVIICAATGEMVIPLLVANLFESSGPVSLLVVEFIISILAGLTFTRFIFYAKENGKYLDIRDSFIWNRTNQTDSASNNKENLVGKSSVNYYSKMEEDSD